MTPDDDTWVPYHIARLERRDISKVRQRTSVLTYRLRYVLVAGTTALNSHVTTVESSSMASEYHLQYGSIVAVNNCSVPKINATIDSLTMEKR